MSKSGIYIIKNMVNGKKYIGQSIDLQKRRGDHFTALRGGYNKNIHLQSAYNKYGESNFEWSVLEECNLSVLDARECSWIIYYDTMNPEYGYNKESGGNAKKVVSQESRDKISASLVGQKRALGHKVSEEVKQKLRLANIGKKASAETKAKMSLSNSGRKLSAEHITKIIASNTGRRKTDEEKRKISESKKGCSGWNKGQHCSVETRKRMSEAAKARPSNRKGCHKKNSSECNERPHLEISKQESFGKVLTIQKIEESPRLDTLIKEN